VDRDIPEPGATQVRIKVQACGVCHSDSFIKEGLFPGIQYPRVPGHEIAGVIDKVGKEITQWQGNVLIILITNRGPGSVMVGKDKPTFHASHHVTAITFLIIGIIATGILFVCTLVLNQKEKDFNSIHLPSGNWWVWPTCI
jgi:threonine dehydrogenase-like Zn-dependent dehydrogenase